VTTWLICLFVAWLVCWIASIVLCFVRIRPEYRNVQNIIFLSAIIWPCVLFSRKRDWHHLSKPPESDDRNAGDAGRQTREQKR
jgi:hypothetical protein